MGLKRAITTSYGIERLSTRISFEQVDWDEFHRVFEKALSEMKNSEGVVQPTFISFATKVKAGSKTVYGSSSSDSQEAIEQLKRFSQEKRDHGDSGVVDYWQQREKKRKEEALRLKKMQEERDKCLAEE